MKNFHDILKQMDPTKLIEEVRRLLAYIPER